MSPIQNDAIMGELTSSKTILTSLLQGRWVSRAMEACPADVLEGAFVVLRQDALTFVNLNCLTKTAVYKRCISF
jgi:hypothetical protein